MVKNVVNNGKINNIYGWKIGDNSLIMRDIWLQLSLDSEIIIDEVNYKGINFIL